jgi:DNA ligase (NAD+)
MPSAEQRVAKLREEINRHNQAYYVEARPTISDQEYDKLMRELIDLEAANPELRTPDSPTQRLGEELVEALRPVQHAVPMMSIDNTYSAEEVVQFDERVRKMLGGKERPAYVLEPKIDGTAISLRYEDGLLVLAATRGRGNVGDDITANARVIRSIPLRLQDGKGAKVPRIVEVRGEVYMENEDFQKVNREIEAAGEEPYANPRNLTSGTVRRLEPRIVAKRRLKFLAHGLGEVDPLPVETYWEWIELLKAWGMPLPADTRRVEDVDEALRVIEAFKTARRTLPYMTDGMVMKVDAFEQRERLGFTAKSPRWVMAYKYETEQQPTVLKDVRWQVGKGGTLTPVGDLEPVFIGGVTVTHATLHNIEQIKRIDLHFGDTVILERAGEVIPYVVGVVMEKRPKGAKPVEAPKKCPSCGQKVEKEEGTPAIRCDNPACPAQRLERLIWFAGRSQMDIDGLGQKLIEQLVENGKVKEFADIFKLKAADICDLTRDVERDGKTTVARIGDKTAERVIAGIEKARSRGLARVLSGLGIPHVGNTVAQDIANAFGDIAQLETASEAEIRRALAGDGSDEREEAAMKCAEALHKALHPSLHPSDLFAAKGRKAEGTLELLTSLKKDGVKVSSEQARNVAERYPGVEGLMKATPHQLCDAMIGRVVAHSLHTFFHSPEGKRVVKGLRDAGVDLTSGGRGPVKPSQFTGKTVVITGSFEKYGRTELRELLQGLGAKVTDSVSKKTDLVLVGVDAGSKAEKAKELSVETWDEARLLKELPAS